MTYAFLRSTALDRLVYLEKRWRTHMDVLLHAEQSAWTKGYPTPEGVHLGMLETGGILAALREEIIFRVRHRRTP